MILGNLPRAMPVGRGAALVAAAMFMLGAAQSSATTLKGVRHSSSAERTRIVLDVTAKATYTHRFLAQPPRVVIDLPGSDVDAVGLRGRAT